MSVCLDTYAILAWLRGENGESRVVEYLEKGSHEGNSVCIVSLINLAEVYYRLYRMRGTRLADAFWREATEGGLPLKVEEATALRVLSAARIKAEHPLVLEDAFAVQLAVEKGVPLLTGDPEILKLKGYPGLDLLPLN